MNLNDFLTRAAHAHGDRVAVELDDQQLTYAELHALAGRTAAFLTARGVQAGDRIGLMLPNVLEFPVLYYGILRAGAVVVPMNPLLRQREIAHCVHDCDMTLLLAHQDAADEARRGAQGTATPIVPVTPGGLPDLLPGHPDTAPTAARRDDDLAVILYTSGTTGVPKGAMLTHAGLARNCEITARLLRLTPDDVMMGCLPLFHAFGQACAMNAAVIAGARLTLLSRFHPGQALRLIADRKVTVFEGVPTMYAALLAEHRLDPGGETASLRLCVSSGASLPVELLHGFEAALGCPVLEGYGMSETSPVVSFNHLDRPRRPGSVGTPIEGVEMRILDPQDGVGELCVRGHNVMAGYWGRPDATAETVVDGWLHTGDLARMDEDGYFYIVDRKKDLIIRGGYNVYPREIEEVLYEHPAVAEAAVIGVRHDLLGEEVAAVVALRPGSRAGVEELQDFVRQRVAPYKYPREIRLVDALPKGPTGKILKREIGADV
ncbi:long-chain fatty acid--CoA ligase [Streptomyces sp. NPDC059378]|uniref:long-chain-fatty-acid--CoA ligase n=1 Tax=Streptomyces sp. NPDC059378 TaxID=3346815 RepID=UPI0036782CB4